MTSEFTLNNAEYKNLDDLTFDQLLSRAKAGSDDARAMLIDNVHEYINASAQRQKVDHLQNKLGASDIVQLTMLEVLKSFDNFRGSSEGEFKAWVKSIVTNQVKQTQRDYSRQKRDAFREVSGNDTRNLAAGFIDQQLTPQSDAIQKENHRRMTAAIENLSEDYRQVIQLRSLQRKPFREVAEIMKRSEDATTKLWFRAVTKLQNFMKRDDESLS